MTPKPGSRLALLAPVAARQHGLFTVRQAKAAGFTKGALDHRLDTGDLVAADYGVYRSVLTPTSWHQRLLAACLAGPAAASHRSSGLLWRYPLDDQWILEVTAFRHRRRHSDGVIWHESYILDDRSITEIDGIPTTNAARTVVDLAAVLSVDKLQRVVDDALRRRLVTTASLGQLMERLGSRRAGASALRAALDARMGSAVPESDLESQFELLIRAHGIPIPTAQWEVVAPDGRRFRIDYAYPHATVGIELLGAQFHAAPERWSADLERLGVLAAMDWHVLLFTYEQVTSRPKTVVRAIELALAR